MPERLTCKDCRWWDRLAHREGRVMSAGFCRVHPPEMRWSDAWPVTNGDEDWCGSFALPSKPTVKLEGKVS